MKQKQEGEGRRGKQDKSAHALLCWVTGQGLEGVPSLPLPVGSQDEGAGC